MGRRRSGKPPRLPRAHHPANAAFIALMGRRYRGSFATGRRTTPPTAKACSTAGARLRRRKREPHRGGGAARVGRTGVARRRARRRNLARSARNRCGCVARRSWSAMANHLCIHLYDLAPNRAPAPGLRATAGCRNVFARGGAPRAHARALLDRNGRLRRGAGSSERAYALLKARSGGLDGSTRSVTQSTTWPSAIPPR